MNKLHDTKTKLQQSEQLNEENETNIATLEKISIENSEKFVQLEEKFNKVVANY